MLKLAACTAFQAVATEPPLDYRRQLAEETGHPVRRLSRFACLALIGAERLKRQAPSLRPDSALYFCSEQPNISDMSRVVHGITIERRPPTPLEFLAVSSNVTGFHVARQLGLTGPNLTMCRSDASIEAGLELAFLTGAQSGGAVVSYVEDTALPLWQHRLRLDLPADGAIAECSHWLYFDSGCPRPLAVVESCVRFPSSAEARAAFVAGQARDLTHVSFGIRVGPTEARDWMQALPAGTQRLAASTAVEFSKGGTAAALCGFAGRGAPGRLLNVNHAASGEVYLVTARSPSVDT